MAGLLAARVLSDHFEQVTLVEKDALPRRPSCARECRRAAMSTRCWRAANA